MREMKTAKRRLPSIIRWILWVLLVQFILINISSAFYAYRLTHFYPASEVGNGTHSGNVFVKTWRLFTGPKTARSSIKSQPAFPYQTITLKTKKDKLIEAWYAPVDSAAKGTVLLFHGVTITKSTVIAEAEEYRNLGYHVMMVDFRAHGNSEGNTTSLGVKEAEDVKLAYDFIAAKGEQRIFLHGVSMGAVVVAKAAHDYQLKLAGIILDMPFASLQSYLKDKARTLGFPKQPFAFLTTFWIGVERGYNGYKHKTSRYVKDLSCPVLMQWGALDYFVLRDETEDIFNAIGSSQKKLVIYERAGHESFVQNDPLKWKIEVGRLLDNAR
jgi:alpha-beta hydrolase superfamily lysophospholipase